MNYIQNLINKYPNLNNVVTLFKKNRYNAFFITVAALLLFMITGMIAFIVIPTNKAQPTNINQKNTNQSTNTSPQITVPTPENLPITTPNPTEAADIENQVQPQITPLVAVPYTVTSVTKYGNTWGTMTLDNPNANIGAVIIKNINGKWKIVAGPGTYFPPQVLKENGIPQELLEVPISPSISLSPSPTPVPGDLQ